MENPHEQQQERLLQRIVTSVARLADVVDAINAELEPLEKHTPTVFYCNDVWAGVNSKLGVSFRALQPELPPQ